MTLLILVVHFGTGSVSLRLNYEKEKNYPNLLRKSPTHSLPVALAVNTSNVQSQDDISSWY